MIWKVSKKRETNHVSVLLEPFAEVWSLKKKKKGIREEIEIEKGKWEKNEWYVVVEEVAMYGPVESVFEGTAVEDPNPLLLRRAPSQVRCRRSHTFCFFQFSSGIGEKMPKANNLQVKPATTSYQNWTRPSQHWAFYFSNGLSIYCWVQFLLHPLSTLLGKF